MLVHSFSAMVSPIPTPDPCLLRNSSLETWGCGERPRGPRPVFLQGARLSSFAFPASPPRFSPSLPSFSRTRSPPHPRATSPGSHTYLAATSPAYFLSAFICISSPLHLFPRRAQHLMLNPDVGKTLPGVPLLPPRPGPRAEPPRVRVPWNQLRSLVLQTNCNRGTEVRRFFCPLGLGWKGRGPPPRGAPLF